MADAPKPGDRLWYADPEDPQWVTVISVTPKGTVNVRSDEGWALKMAATWLVETPAHHRHRSEDRPTSIAAAKKIKGGTGKAKVLLALAEAGEHGLIDHDHAPINGVQQDSAGKRRLELMREYTPTPVVDSGRTRKSPRGDESTVWVITSAGYALARTLQARGAA